MDIYENRKELIKSWTKHLLQDIDELKMWREDKDPRSEIMHYRYKSKTIRQYHTELCIEEIEDDIENIKKLVDDIIKED